jgi:hypothetical protein
MSPSNLCKILEQLEFSVQKRNNGGYVARKRRLNVTAIITFIDSPFPVGTFPDGGDMEIRNGNDLFVYFMILGEQSR